MAVCTGCGAGLDSQLHDCPRGRPATAAAPPRPGFWDRGLEAMGGRENAIRIVTYVGSILALVASGYFGGLPLLLTVFPPIAGAVVMFGRPLAAMVWVGRFESLLDRRRAVANRADGRWARYAARPCYAGFALIEYWTRGIGDGFLKAGVRVIGYLYFAAVIALAAYVAVMIAVVVIAVIIGLLILSLVLSFMDKSGSSRTVSGRVFGGARRLIGTKIVKEGLLFDTPTGVKINKDGRIAREGLVFDTPTGAKVNESGQIIDEGILLDSPTGVRIKDDGQIVREGFIGDVPSGYKVNEHGQLVKEGLLFDTPTGIKFKKEKD